MNQLFQNAIKGQAQKTPPIWFMRQAGRYHSHYQGLRSKHSFDDLCRIPELAAQVALGPIEDFDFDVSILFSDLLYPLDALGMGLSYSDHGPKLDRMISTGFEIKANLDEEFLSEALDQLQFQAKALKLTREALPTHKSLIGFVGGIWTLFVYACEGGHSGSMTFAKNHFFKQDKFVRALSLLVEKNIQLQLNAGAEVVMVFDTAAGEVSSEFFKMYIQPQLLEWSKKFPRKIGYYSKGTTHDFFTDEFKKAPWAGRGVDHRWSLPSVLKNETAIQAIQASNRELGFLQGNFDQAMLFQDTDIFVKNLDHYIQTFQQLSERERAGWVCGLGHGVLPKTPEKHVHLFIEKMRKAFA